MKRLITLLFFAVVTSVAKAQTGCEEAIQNAEKAFQAGKFIEAITVLQPCAGSRMNFSDKALFNRLMSLSYFRLDSMGQSDLYARKLLKHYPEYRQFPQNDPKDFTKYLESYHVKVAWQLGIRAGGAISFPHIIKQYTVSEQVNTYKSSTQYAAGLQITRNMGKFGALRFEPGYCRIQYNRHADDVLGVSQDYSETQNYLDLPVNYLFYTSGAKANFFVGAGFNTAVLTGAYGLIESRDAQTENRIVDSYAVRDQRRKMLFAANIGAGCDVSAGKGRLGCSVFWQEALQNMVIPDRRYDEIPKVITGKYIENDFNINVLRVQFYYQIPLAYKVSK